MLLLCSPTELCACAVTGLAIQTPSGTGQTDLTSGQGQGQITRCQFSASQASVKRAELSSVFVALSLEALATPITGQQPPAKSSWSPCHNSSQRPAREDCTTRPWSVFSTAQPENPSFFPAQLFSISAQETCPVFDSWSCFMKQSWAGCLGGMGHEVVDNSGFWTPTQNKGELCQGSGEPGVSTQTGYWRKHERKVFFLCAVWGVWNPPSLFLSCLLATAFFLVRPIFQ